MDVRKRLFIQDPPKEPLTSLAAIVRDWHYRFGKHGEHAHMRDEIVEACRNAVTYTGAVTIACASKRPNGKMHNHQSRVDKAALAAMRERLLAHRSEVRHYARVSGFDGLHDYIAHHIAPPGIGPVTIYDVAVRLGAWLKVEPDSVYLHAGVREGWLTLLMALDPSEDVRHWRRRHRVSRSGLPAELSAMPADEIEDFLCTYRDVFGGIERGS